MGRTTAFQPPIGLQRHSVVGPGPGALQRALAARSVVDEPAVTAGAAVGGVARTAMAPERTIVRRRSDGTANTPNDAVGQGQPQRRNEPVSSLLDLAPGTRQPADRPDIARMPAAPPAARTAPDQSRPGSPPSSEAARTSTSPAVARIDRPGVDRPRVDRRSPDATPRRVFEPALNRTQQPGRRLDPIVQRAADPAADPQVRAGETAAAVDTPAPPTASLGDRFLHELSRQPAPAPQPLPERYQPMARAITGHHRVMLSVNDASRRALRSVDKVAATTGNVIHLHKPLAPGARAAEVLAHELTHVAHPSPAPRFFDDDVRSPEERQAEQVAKVMARAPLAPNGTISRARSANATPAVSRAGSGSDIIRRSPASSSPGTINAAALANEMLGGPKVQRSSQPAARQVSHDHSPGTVRRSPDTSVTDTEVTDTETTTERDVQNDFRAQLDLHFDYLLRRLERRMVIELERRGGRFWRGV